MRLVTSAFGMRTALVFSAAAAVLACGGAIEPEETGKQTYITTIEPEEPEPAVAPVPRETTTPAADGDTCASLGSLPPSGKLEVIDSPLSAELLVEVAARESDEMGVHTTSLVFSTLPGLCEWQKAGIQPVREAHAMVTFSGEGTGVFEGGYSDGGSSLDACPAKSGGAWTATSGPHPPLKVTITERSATSIRGTVQGEFILMNFEAPLCAGVTPRELAVRCCM